MCIEKLPSPVEAQPNRIPKFIAEPPQDYPEDLRAAYQKMYFSNFFCPVHKFIYLSKKIVKTV